MRSVLGLGLRMAWGSPEQRVRSVAVAVASALGTAALLLVWVMAKDRLVGAQAFNSEADLVVAGTVGLVALPVVAMVATVARLQTRSREARLANLRRLGLSATRTRLVAGVEVGVASASGVLLGIPLYVLAARLVQLVDVAGQPWNPNLFRVTRYEWPWVVLGVLGVAVLVAAWPPRESGAERGVDPDQPDEPGALAGWWRLLPLLVGLLACGWSVRNDFPDYDPGPVAYVALGGSGLAGAGLLLAAPVLVRLFAGVAVRLARRPATLIAARRLQTRPGAVLRVVGTLMAVLVVLAGTHSVLADFRDLPQYREAERSLADGQVAEVTAGADEVDATVARLMAAPGVEKVLDLPVALIEVPGQDPDQEPLRAAIATCADLAEVGAPVPGCVEGRVLVGDDRPALQSTGLGRLTSLLMDGDPPSVPSASLDLADAVQAPAGELHDWQIGGDVNVVVPPGTPGIAEVLATTNRSLLVQAAPGRGLMTAMDRAGVNGYLTTWGTEDHDFTEGITVLAWTVAGVLLLLGTFALGVALVDLAGSRRAEIASLRVHGTPQGVLRRAQWWEAVLPVLLGTVSAVLVGWFAGNAWLSLAGTAPASVPWPLLAGAVLASLVVAVLTLVGTGAEPRPEDAERA